MSSPEEFDVFLCHNSQEKAVVEKIREQLKQWRIYAWLDKYDFEPFRPWQKQLEEIIPQIKAAAIFIGSSGVGPWANIEMSAFLSEFAQNQIRMGLVILPGCPDELIKDVPRFMKSFHWVDFRQSDPDPMEQLVWGITGVKPSGLGSVSSPPSVGEMNPDYAKQQNNLSSFEFEMATVQLQEVGGSSGSGTRVIVNRSHKETQYFGENLGGGITISMVSIPTGSFMMGAQKNELGSGDDERPRHRVNVKAFFMGKFPVTQAQWRAVAAMPKVKTDLDPDPSSFKGDDRLPVESVFWLAALEFCRRLSKETGKDYRLPSEAEWEYACRAGTTTPFHFGEMITPELVNYNGEYPYADAPKGEYRQKTTPVGSFPANAFGLYDMHGNVWEWCADDWHGDYEGAPTDGSIWMKDVKNYEDAMTAKLLRGGSWSFNAQDCRSAFRRRFDADLRSDFFGFRVVCVLR